VDIVGKCGDFFDQQVPSDDHYRFYLAFENHNCPDYITEKFFNVIRTRKMIPIVMGASKEAYNLFGPEGSFIHVDDFEGPAALGAFLQQLKNDSVEYNKFFEWQGTGYHYNTRTMCRVCSTLNYLKESGEHKEYTREDLVKFWSPLQCSAKRFAELDNIEENGAMHKERLIDQQKGFDKDFVERHREDLGLLFIDEEDYEEEEDEVDE